MERKIMVAYDGSELSKKALNEAEIQAVACYPEAEVHIIGAVTQAGPVSNDLMARDIAEETVDNMRQQLQEAAQSFDASGQTVRTDVLVNVNQKNAGHKLAEYASEQDMDLIIIGSRGTGGMQKFLLGSVSAKVLQKAECYVMIIN